MTTEPSDIDLLNQIPKIIGTYEISEELGAGLLGGVCSAIHKYTDERVAIKIFSKSSLQIYRSELPLINNEISVLKILNHKNIIKLYEVFESPTHIYLVTEHCSGKELFDLISSKKRLTEPEAKTLFYQVISALEYMHSMNVCHRDIKPENILFDSKGQIKLTDFDFSCYYSNKQTQLHEDLGTPSYACPEMHKGEMYLPELADVWSCGVLLYVMVCGCCPFNDEDENENENESAIIQGVYDVPSYLSDSVVDLIKHMIQPDVSQRYTFKEVIQHEWLNDVSSDSDNDNNVVSKGVNYFEMKYPIDSRILNICETYGFDQVRIRNDLQSNKFNCYTAVYKLFVKKVYDAGISCLNDYCSDEYKAYIEDERNYYTEEEKREVRERFEMKERERKEKLEEQEKEMFEKEERAFKELNDIDKELTNNNAVCPNEKITTPIRKRMSNKKVNNDNNNEGNKLLTTPDKRPNNTFNKSALVSSNTSCKKSKFKSAIESIVKSPMKILYHNNIRSNTNFSLKDKHNNCSNNNNKACGSSNNSDDNDDDDDDEDDYSSENSNSSSSEYDSASVSSYSDNNYNNNNINALTPVKENISDRGDTSETQNKYKQLHLTNDDSYYSITDNCSASPKLSSKTNLIYTNIIGEKLQQTLIQPNNTPSNIKYRKHTLNPEMLRKHPARRRNAVVNRNEIEQALRIYHENMLNDSSNFSDDDSSSYHSSYMSNSVISLKLPQAHKNVNDSSYDSTDANGLNVPKELNQGEYELYQRLALELIERNKQEEEERQRIINEDKKRYEEEQQRIKEAKDQQRKEEEQRKKEELKLKLQKRRLVAQILQNVNKSKSLNQQHYNDMGVTEQIVVDEQQQQQQQRSRKASVNKRSGTKYTSIADIRKLLTKTPNSTKTRRFSMTLSSKQHQPHNETITRVRKSTIANNSHNMHISSLVIFETPDNNKGLNKRISYIKSNGNNGNHHLQNQSTKSEIKIKPFINKENINTTNTFTESNVKQFITKNKSFAPPINDNSFSSLLITNHKAKISDVSEKSCTNKEFKKKMLRQKVLGDGYNKAFIAELEEFKLKKMEENMKFKEELEKLEKFKDTQNEKYQMQLIMIRMEKLKKLKENNKLITKLERAVIRENSFVDNNINNTGNKSMMKRLSTRKKEVFIFDEGVTKIPGNFELQVTDNDNNIIKQDEMNTTKRKHKHKHRDKDKDKSEHRDKEKSKHKSEHKDKDKEHKEHKEDKAHKDKDKDKHEHKEKRHKDKTELKRTKHKKKHHTKNKSIISINEHNTKTHETIVNANTNANTNHISNNNNNHHHIINKFTNREINKHNKHIPITNTLSSSNITMNNRTKKLPPPINPSSITIPNNTATAKPKRPHKRNHNKENEDDKFKRQTLKFEKLIKEVKVKEPTHKPSPSKHELKIRTNTTTTHIPTHTRTNTSITMPNNSNIHHHSRTKSQNTNLIDKVNKDSSILSKQHHHQPSKKQPSTNTVQDNTSDTKAVPSLNGYKINFFHQKPDLNLSFSFLNNQSNISGIHHNTSFNCGGVNNNNNINPNFSITNTTNICITNRSVIETNNNNNNTKHNEQQRDKNDDDLSMCFTERLFYNSKQNSFSLNPSKSKFKSSLYKSNSNNPNIYHNKKENSFNFGEYKDKASLLKRIHIRTESMPIQEEIFQNEHTHKNQSKSKGVSNIKHTNSTKDNNNTKHIHNNSNLTKSIELYNYDSKKDVSINQYDSNTVNKKYIHSKKTILSNRLCKSKHIHHQHHKSVFNTMSNNLSGYNLSQSINNNNNNNSTSHINISNNNNEPSTIKSNKLNTSTTMTKSQSSTKTPIKNNDAFNMSHSTNISNINSTNTSMQYYHINNNSNYPLNTFYNNTNTTNKSMVQHSSHSNYNSISSSNQYSTNTNGSTQNNKQTLHKSTKTQPFLDKDIYNTDITLSKPNTSRVSTNNVHKRNENRSNIYHPNHNTIIINKRNAKNVLPSMTTTHVKEPTYYEGLVDISCISTVSLRETVNQLVAKLKLHNVFYLQVNSYTYRCNKKKTSFDIEICQIYSKMYYYMLKIKSGGVNMQKEVISQLFSN